MSFLQLSIIIQVLNLCLTFFVKNIICIVDYFIENLNCNIKSIDISVCCDKSFWQVVS